MNRLFNQNELERKKKLCKNTPTSISLTFSLHLRYKVNVSDGDFVSLTFFNDRKRKKTEMFIVAVMYVYKWVVI